MNKIKQSHYFKSRDSLTGIKSSSKGKGNLNVNMEAMIMKTNPMIKSPPAIQSQFGNDMNNFIQVGEKSKVSNGNNNSNGQFLGINNPLNTIINADIPTQKSSNLKKVSSIYMSDIIRTIR
jgi:hypothetical protein